MRERIDAGGRSFSFEFFPGPRRTGHLWDAIRRLEPLQPTLVSVTYGAGGTTRDRTVEITAQIAHQTTLTRWVISRAWARPQPRLRGVVAAYADAGVHHVLALRGG